MVAEKKHIDFKNAEKLVLVEAQRKKELWERKSKKLLVILIVFLILFLSF